MPDLTPHPRSHTVVSNLEFPPQWPCAGTQANGKVLPWRRMRISTTAAQGEGAVGVEGNGVAVAAQVVLLSPTQGGGVTTTGGSRPSSGWAGHVGRALEVLPLRRDSMPGQTCGTFSFAELRACSGLGSPQGGTSHLTLFGRLSEVCCLPHPSVPSSAGPSSGHVPHMFALVWT